MSGENRTGRTHSDVGRQVSLSADEDVKQLLEMAVGLHQGGELGRARELYERIIEQQPAHADALHFLGLACFQQGDGDRAVALIRRAIEHKPEVAHYHDNLGAVLEARGELESALAAFRDAERLAGDDAERSFNVGVVLARLGRYTEAESAYRNAIELAPEDGGFHYNLATLLKGLGRLEEAVEHFDKAVEIRPDYADAHNNLGNTLQALGRVDEAARAYSEAIRRRPQDATSHVNLANLQRKSSSLEEAAAGYSRALSLNPTLDDARLALAQVQHALGRFETALETYRSLLARQPDHPAALSGLASTLRFHPVAGYEPELCAAIERCFDEPSVHAQDLAAACARQLRDKYRLDAGDADVQALVEQFAHDSLVIALLERTINVDAEIERALTRVRAHIALGRAPVAHTPSRLRLAAAIATQCFVNEYVFTSSPQEEQAAAERRARLERLLARNAGPDDALRLECALLAMYQPLLDVEGGERLGDWDHVAWGECLWPLIGRIVNEPLRERDLLDDVDSIGDAENSISAKVRAQYEQNPYPRWLELPRRKPVSYQEYLSRRFPHFEPPDFLSGTVEVLAAGCGTGQEAIAIAAGRSNSRVLGLDLSQRSLAYARRMAQMLGVDNVQFVQGDVLKAESLGQRFHVIECTGVLHHMADPLAGWRVLRECLLPGGLMKIGLYSERARADVEVARQRILAQSLQPVEHDIRAFRAEVMAAPQGTSLAALAESEDMYTMSACRDLLFHAQEHRFSIPGVAHALESLELDFIGFETAIPGVSRDYARFNSADPDGTDLSGWERFEQEHPELFAALYLFWCRRRT